MINGTLLSLTLRQYLGWHRLGLLVFLFVLGALPPIIAASFLGVARWDPQIEATTFDFARGLFSGFQLPLLYPVIGLILTATVLREEIQNGTIPYLWLKPLSRPAIVLSKFLGAWLIAFVISGASLSASAWLLTSDGVLIARQLLTLVGALLAYGALFFLLGTLFDRGLVWGFAYLLGWEESFSRISPAASELSIRHYAEALERNLAGATGEIQLATSLSVLLGLAVISFGLAVWRFTSMEFTGGEA